MALIQLSAGALDDLDEIESYIAATNPQAGQGIRRRIIERIQALSTMPRIGRPGRVPDTRELAITGTPFIAPYWLPREDVVEILAVLHGARRWPASFPRTRN